MLRAGERMVAVVRLGVLAGVLVLLAGCGRGERDATRQAAAELQRLLSGRAPGFVMAHHDGARIWKTLRTFYGDRRYQPAWIDGTRPTRQLDALLRALDAADRHGLDPQIYDIGPLSQARAQVRRRLLGPAGFQPELVGPVDLRLSAAWLEFASDLSNGVTARPHADPMWRIRPRSVDLLPALRRALAEDRVEEALGELAPPHDEYRWLAAAHASYRERERAGGWPALPAGLTLRPNQRSRHLAALARRLADGGDIDAGTAANPPATYDVRLQQAVRRFARRHALPDSPVLTRQVVAAMNVPIAGRLRQIELNMERWRWFPRDLGDPHIRVNVPEFQLEIRERQRVVAAMDVIVGARETPTPIFSDTMTTVVFAPFWNVPTSIAVDETLPAIASDPEYLARNNLEVIATSGEVVDPETIDWTAIQEVGDFPYRFRQRPGTANSLGLVKFLFPNDFDVYLHDTPARTLFAKPFRALSHGCVRVEDPVALAEYLLREEGRWHGARIREAMNGGEEQHVRLPRPIKVHLMYWTARADASGTVRFFPDLYGHDARQWADYQSRVTRVKRQRSSGAAPAPPAGGGPAPSRGSRAGTASR